jgi:hypothetical protein
MLLAQDAVEQRGFTGAQEAGQDGGRDQCHVVLGVG